MAVPSAEPRKPLTGIKVLSLEQFRAGPTATLLLADAGAEVIRIEPPITGEPGRSLTITDKHGHAVPFLAPSLSRNKKSLSLNLRSDKGKELFKSLVKCSDIVLENMRPDVLDRLGLGYEVLKQVNPGIVYVSISGFGHRGTFQSPYWDWPAFDLVGQALAGFMYRAGREDDPPLLNTAIVADTVPGFLAAFGALAAIVMRNQTGQGQHVDIAMYDSMVLLNNFALCNASLTGERVPKRGKLPVSAPYGAYKAKDDYFVIGVAGEHMWQRFCQAIGREDLISWPELEDGATRSRNDDTVLRPIIEEWAKDRTVQEASHFLMGKGVPAAPVQNELDLLSCPHLKARNMLVEIACPNGGKVMQAGNPIKFSAVPEESPSPPPGIGEHTYEIFGEMLGLGHGELEGLREQGII
jgi:crotonobetainyl-CoA:carnitine CoA-transferase CaiB-like acyl-CoA transferase